MALLGEIASAKSGAVLPSSAATPERIVGKVL